MDMGALFSGTATPKKMNSHVDGAMHLYRGILLLE